MWKGKWILLWHYFVKLSGGDNFDFVSLALPLIALSQIQLKFSVATGNFVQTELAEERSQKSGISPISGEYLRRFPC